MRFVDYLKTTNVGEDAERRIAGVIAHEAQAVFSNVVSGEKDAVEEDGRLNLQTVDYTGLGIYVGAAVQHMASLMDSLSSDVAKLRAEVAILRGTR
nr:tail fiber domain-containing protein [Burkholderia diffusa]